MQEQKILKVDGTAQTDNNDLLETKFHKLKKKYKKQKDSNLEIINANEGFKLQIDALQAQIKAHSQTKESDLIETLKREMEVQQAQNHL